MQKRTLKKILAGLWLSLVAVTGAGCVAVAVGAGAAGTVAYVRGDLQVTYEASLDAVHHAAHSALRDDLGFAIVDSNLDRAEGIIVSRTAQDRRVAVELERAGDRTTNASIRIGTFGDRELSMTVHERIKERL